MDKFIIRRFLNGQASSSEIEQVQRWLDKPGSGLELEELVQEAWNQTEHPPRNKDRNERLLVQINSTIRKNSTHQVQKQRVFKWELIRSAAAWMVFIALSFLAFQVIFDNKSKQEERSSTNEWVERSVMQGQKLVLELPDDSKVWVNAHSMIRFPEKFSRDSREVFLKGRPF